MGRKATGPPQVDCRVARRTAKAVLPGNGGTAFFIFANKKKDIRKEVGINEYQNKMDKEKLMDSVHRFLEEK